MFTSLRTRLWLSYALLIGMVLCVVGAGLLVTLVNSPLANRALVLRLRTAEAAGAFRAWRPVRFSTRAGAADLAARSPTLHRPHCHPGCQRHGPGGYRRQRSTPAQDPQTPGIQ